MENEKNRLQFKMTVDKSNQSPRCTVYYNGKNYGSTAGVGYDLKGVCLSHFIKRRFLAQLKRLDATGINGFQFYNIKTKTWHQNYQQNYKILLDGSYGFASMEEVMERLGYTLIFEKETKASSWYELKEI